MRTREGREAEVIEQVKTRGGFSVFWATESQTRAHAIDRLSGSGRIVRKRNNPRDVYPWCVYAIAKAAAE
jgi:hypothetical protein